LNKIISFLSAAFLLLAVPTTAMAQADSLVSVKATATLLNDSSYTIVYSVSVKEGWQVYGTTPSNESDPITTAPKLSFALETAHYLDNPVFSINAIQQKDPLFEKAFIFPGPFEVRSTIAITGFQPDTLRGSLVLAIAKGNEFYEKEIPVSLFLANGKKTAGVQILLPPTATTPPAGACGEAAHDSAQSSLWTVFVLGFLGGLIALITPCVFPMIPVTVSFFTKRSKTKKQGIANGLIYGLCIFLIYVLASLPFHIMGNVQPEIFNSISTSPVLNIIFFVIFIFFSISFFGYFEITLPSGIANKADAKSGLGSLGGIFFMAITLAIVSFSCTGPILGTLLVGSLQGGAWALTMGMAGFGVALALPFTLFAIFPQWLQSLPKSGGWLDTVKKVLAFLELALAFKFLSNADLVQHWGLLKREVFLGLWAVISIGLALYLWGKLQLPHDTKGAKISIGRKIGGALAIAFSVVLIMGIFPKNASYIQFLSGFPPPSHYSLLAKPTDDNRGVEANVVNDYQQALTLAKEQNKPILIDFTGWACVNCRKMEENVWTDPAIASYIKDQFILVSLYVDDKAMLPVDKRFKYTSKAGTEKAINSVGDLWATFQAENFNQVTQPLYVVISPNQELLSNPVGYTPDAEVYLQWLQCSVAKGKP
jgi:cytochrome c biogenesis protein CcdA/thioredoxin-related protein